MLEVIETEPAIRDHDQPQSPQNSQPPTLHKDPKSSAVSASSAVSRDQDQPQRSQRPQSQAGSVNSVVNPSAIRDHDQPQSTQNSQSPTRHKDPKSSAVSASSAVSHDQIRGEIEFRDLTFSYGSTPVLSHVSARIAAGETAAIVGVTGSGKSTLIGLLARLHDPPPRTVFLDGVDVRTIPLATLRGAIGFVPQEPFLFSDTIADNIAFGLDAHITAGTAVRLRAESAPASLAEARDGTGRAEADAGDEDRARRERIEAAAAVARLDKDLADFPRGYDTMVGERGITLSGGQKQRTALARAIVIDPRVLILDDSLSAVDTYTEEEILTGLREVMRQRTSIIVSHRISTVRGADQIFVLDQGRIVEHGTHETLVRLNGLYAELHRKQLLEEELAAS
jgi:ATP-binding cassette subfamily B multidrug efflux pump